MSLSRRTFDRGGHTGGLLHICFHPSSRLLASCGADQRLKLWEIDKQECVSTFHKFDGWIYACAISHNGSMIACACADQIVRIFDLASLRLLFPESRGILGLAVTTSHQDREATTFKGPVICLDFSSEDSWLCVGAADNTVTLWRVADGECYQTLEGHSDGITSVRFSPDGMMLLSASYDGTAKIWRVSDGRLVASLEEHSGFVSGAEWGEKGQLIATCSGDGLVLVWDPDEARVIHRLEGHESWVLAIAFAPRDHILVSCGADKLVILWDALTGSLLSTIDAHSDWVESVCFDPTGMMLASAGLDRDIRVWDVTAPSAPTLKYALSGRRLRPVLSWLYYKAVDLREWLTGSNAGWGDDEAVADERLGFLDGHDGLNDASEDPKMAEIVPSATGNLAERAMALVRDDVLGISIRDQVALATLFLSFAGGDGRVPKNAFANACAKDPALTQLLAQEDDKHKSVEQKLRELPAYITWEDLLACFEASHVFDSGANEGFRISVLGF